MKKAELIIIVAVLALGVGIFARYAFSPEKYAPAKTAVAFDLPDLAGKTHKNTEWQGKIQVVNFWATWCAPCRKEIPEFIKLQAQYADKNVQFIGIAVDEEQAVREFLANMNANYPMLIGGDAAGYLARQLGNHIGALPYTVIINPQGVVVHQQVGEFTTEEVIKVLSTFSQ